MAKLNLIIRKLLLKNTTFYTLAFLSLFYSFIILHIKQTSIYNISNTNFTGIIESYTMNGDKLTLILKSEEKLKGNYYFKTKEEKDNFFKEHKLGYKVKITGELSIPSNNTIPNTFNYKKYLYNNGVFFLCNIESISILTTKTNVFYRIKNSIIERIQKYTKISGYLETFILGDKSLLNNDIYQTYQKNGVTHLFAISGMHIGFFAGFLLKILKKVGETKRYLIVITFIWFYAFLTSFSPSVLRAGLLFTLLSLNKIFYTEVKSINVLILTGTILIFINPFIILNIGFIYSFLTTFGLMYASDTLKKHKIMGTSIVAFLASLPVTINNFYEFNVLGIFYNIVFVPYVSLLAYPLCLLTFLIKQLEPITYIVLKVMEYMSITLSKLSFGMIISPSISIIGICMYYFIYLKYINKNVKKCLCFIVVLLILNMQKYRLDTSYNFTFLDVGQGDSLLIRTSHNKEVILIDTGGKMEYEKEEWQQRREYHLIDNTIVYLKSVGIKTIDYLVLTHGDADHMGEASVLIDNFKVDNVIFNVGNYNYLEKMLITKLNQKKIPYTNSIDKLGLSINLKFLNTKDYNNENTNSNVIYTEVMGYKFLLMGDADKARELDILSQYAIGNIDVLKVGHHGSKTSSDSKFIATIKPKYSVISVGKKNKYNHPNAETLVTLKNSKIYRTDKDGSVMFKIKNSKLKVKTYAP